MSAVKIAVALGALALVAVPFPAGPASGAEGDTLEAFTTEAEGAPVAVLLYEPASGIPVDPGEPHLQATFSFTNTTLETGPKSRALASSIWPGAAIGDGFSTLCECDESWRVRAVAQQPGGEEEASQEIPEFDAGMHAKAKGLNVYAEADGGGAPSPQIPVTMANGSSQSTSTVEKGFAVARSVVNVKNVQLLEGVITVGSVATTIEALSNTEGAKSTGTTTVNGLTIGGNGYRIDGKGLHPIQSDKEGDAVLPGPPEEIPGEKELREQLGISVYLDEHTTTAESTTATREAAGLRISIETAKLRDRIDEGPIYPFLEELPAQLDQVQAPVYQLLASAPRIDFVLGRAFVESASVIPYEFEIPPIGGPLTSPPPPASAPPAPSSGSPTLSSGGVSSVGGGAPSTSVASPSVASSAARPGPIGQPLAAPPGQAATPAGAQLPPLFGGLPPGLVIGAMAAAAVAARGLGRVTGLAMGTGGGALCSDGTRKTVPNLRDQ